MTTPDDRKYTESHEWIKLDGEMLTLGLTQVAVDELTDITYVEMKTAGETVGPGDSVGEVESVKAASDVYSPLGGKIHEVNAQLADDPSLLNTDPYGEGWLIKIKVADASGFDDLLDASAYQGLQG